MANKSKSMLQVRRILQLLSGGESKREVCRQTGISRNTIDAYAKRFQASGKGYEELLQMADNELAALAYAGESKKELPARRKYLEEHLDYYVKELKRNGVTRELLWREYRQEQPEGYSYSQFCELLSQHRYKKEPVYHKTYTPGAILEVDFAGSKMKYIDRATGKGIECPVLVCTFPYSSLSYIEPLESGRLEHLLPGLNRAMEYFGGVPKVVLSDNMKQFVRQSSRYEPCFTQLAEQWSVHYHTTLKATRPYKPRDKASVEKSVHLSYQRINARMRDEVFYSLTELRRRVFELMEEFNNRKMFHQEVSRKERFLKEEKPFLKDLPAEPFLLKYRTKAKVKSNYHVILGEDWHLYSVPYQYIGQEVTIVYDQQVVEVLAGLKRIAIHKRDSRRNGYTTLKEHMPEAHLRYSEQKEWTEEDFLTRASEIGEQTRIAISKMLGTKAFIEQTYDGCLGVLRLANKYGNKRLEAACKRANTAGRITYRILYNILKNNMDKASEMEKEIILTIPEHDNIRGAEAYS